VNTNSRHYSRRQFTKLAAQARAAILAELEESAYWYARDAFHWAARYIESGGRW
jgi:hypothetical protein